MGCSKSKEKNKTISILKVNSMYINCHSLFGMCVVVRCMLCLNGTMNKSIKQVCIPVGCIPTACLPYPVVSEEAGVSA